MAPSELEQIEKLEQLRALENGMRITCMHAEYDGRGIDTPADLEAFRSHIKTHSSEIPMPEESRCLS